MKTFMQHLVCLITVMFLTFPLFSQELNKEMKKGLTYFEEGFYEFAMKEFDKVLTVEADHLDAQIKRGQCLYFLDLHTEALHVFNNLIKKHSLIPELYVSRGFVHSIDNRPWKAIADFSRAIELDPGNPDYYYNRGCIFDDVEIYDMAVLNYTEAIDLFPNDADYHFNRGFSNEQLGKLEEAVKDYSAVLELNKTDSEAYLSRAIVYLLMEGREAEACADLAAAADLDDERAKVLQTVQCDE